MAPFYLALPRGGSGPRNVRQSSGRTQYVRSPPSSVFVTAIRTATNRAYLLVGCYLFLISSLLAAANYAKSSITMTVPSNLLGCSNLCDVGSILVLAHPMVTLAFIGKPTAEQEEILDGWNCKWFFLPKKGRCAIFDLDSTRLAIIASWSNVDSAIEPMAGTVRISDHPQLTLLIQLVSTVLISLQLAYSANAVKINVETLPTQSWEFNSVKEEKDKDGKIKVVGIPATMAFATTHMSRGYDFLQFASWQYGSPTIDAAKQHMVYKDTAGHRMFLDFASSRDQGILWSRSIPSPLAGHGIYLPYEPNYTSPDRQALTQFANTFSQFFINEDATKNILPEMQDAWLSSIHRTPVGETLAHIMSTAVIAARVFGGVKVVSENMVFEGCIIHSATAFRLTQRDVNVDSVDSTQLLLDAQEYNAHSKVLGEFANHFTLAAIAGTISSARELRNLIFASRAGKLTDADVLFINERALFLNFPQRPEQVTADALKRFLGYISPAAVPIPKEVFLPFQCLTLKNDEGMALALCMFGYRSISPISNGGVKPLVASANKDVPVYAPPVVKFSRKPLQNCVTDWIGCSQSSAMIFDERSTQKKVVTIRGLGAGQVWAAMAEWAQVHVAHNAISKAKIVRDNTTGKRKDREDDEGQGGPSQKKKFVPSFVPESASSIFS